MLWVLKNTKSKGTPKVTSFLALLLNLSFRRQVEKDILGSCDHITSQTQKKKFKRKWPSLSPLSNHCKVWKCLMNCNAGLWNIYSVSVFPEPAELQTSLFRFVHKNDIWPSVFRPFEGNYMQDSTPGYHPLRKKVSDMA